MSFFANIRNSSKAGIAAAAVVALSNGCSLPEKPTPLTVEETKNKLSLLDGTHIEVVGMPGGKGQVFTAPAAELQGREGTFVRYRLTDPKTGDSLDVIRLVHAGKTNSNAAEHEAELLAPESQYLFPDGQAVVRVYVDKTDLAFERVEDARWFHQPAVDLAREPHRP